MKNNFFSSKRYQNLNSLLVVLFLLLPLGNVTKPSLAEFPTALVLVNLQNETKIEDLVAVVQTYYLRFDAPQGNIQLLLPADPNQREMLLHLGFDLKVLDSDMRGKHYYQLYGTPETLRQVEAFCVLLFSLERQAVVRLSPDQVDHLERMGVMVHALFPRPLIVPARTSADVDRNLAFPSFTSPDPVVEEMVSQVDSDVLYDYVGNLSGEWPVIVNGTPYTFYTRYTYYEVPMRKVTRFAYDHFQSLRIPVSYHYYYTINPNRRSVIAEQTGLTHPQRIFMVIAHLDSFSNNPFGYAPGADDNASGSAAVMAIADILSQYDFGCTLRYALFTGEEQGYYGSWAYAQSAYQSGEDIEGVLNLDMISYNSLGTSPALELHTRPNKAGDLAIANLFDDSVSAYSLDLEPDIYQDGETQSDHAPFWNYDYPAIMAIEDWSDHTPFYHSTGDQLETLNLPYYTEFTKAALATVAHMGCLLEGKLQGTIRDSVTSDPLPGAIVHARSVDGKSFSTTSRSDGFYQLPLQPGAYTITFSATDHRTETVENIQIILDQTTTLDRSLQPCIAVHDVDFSFNPNSPQIDETITFDALAGGGELPINYTWDFRDGSNAIGDPVSHAYHGRGVYTVKLIADNSCYVPTEVLRQVLVDVELVYLPLVSR